MKKTLFPFVVGLITFFVAYFIPANVYTNRGNLITFLALIVLVGSNTWSLGHKAERDAAVGTGFFVLSFVFAIIAIFFVWIFERFPFLETDKRSVCMGIIIYSCIQCISHFMKFRYEAKKQTDNQKVYS